jgi:hypothetical protein
VKILASEIQTKRSSNYDENKLSPISDRWVDWFRTRHSRIKTCLSHTIDTARSIALDFSTIKSYFDNLGEVLREHRYSPSAIYNVDETRFSIGSSRKSVVLLDQLDQRREKKQPGRQEWITCLVCQRLGSDPTSMSDFQRRKSKFRLDSKRKSSRLEFHYVEERLD